jgi:hypothetical protein
MQLEHGRRLGDRQPLRRYGESDQAPDRVAERAVDGAGDGSQAQSRSPARPLDHQCRDPARQIQRRRGGVSGCNSRVTLLSRVEGPDRYLGETLTKFSQGLDLNERGHVDDSSASSGHFK